MVLVLESDPPQRGGISVWDRVGMVAIHGLGGQGGVGGESWQKGRGRKRKGLGAALDVGDPEGTGSWAMLVNLAAPMCGVLVRSSRCWY